VRHEQQARFRERHGRRAYVARRAHATNPKAGRVTHDIDGTQYVWDFFKNYSLSGSR
jgi:hypothetical protein